MDPELRDALDRLAEDLRGGIRSGDAETRVYVDERATELRAYIDERIGTSAVETRRHFDVVGRFDEQNRRTGGLEGRVLGLEARVLILEDDRKPRRPRRQQ